MGDENEIDNMKTSATFAAVFLLAAAAGTSALVMKKPNKVQLGAVKQCAGGPYDIQLTSGNLPDVINIPGTVDVNMETEVVHTLPKDLMVSLKLKKYQPYPLDVPCINGIGSCEYDGCKVLEALCNTLPKDVPCKCPMPEGHYNFNNVPLKIPDMGAIMDNLMVGKYNGEIQFYGKTNPSHVVGCFDMDFEFTHKTASN